MHRLTTPTTLDTPLFRPMFCWFEDGRYSDFYPSRMQVSMCHDFVETDPRIIEVDIRVATCLQDATHVGIMGEDGTISCVFEHPSALVVCGPRKSWVPVNITDMRTLGIRHLAAPVPKIDYRGCECYSE